MAAEPVICPYCGQPAVLTSSEEVYGRDYGLLYLCAPCDAYVGVHRGTTKPKGTLANAELREWRKRAHAAFDPLWQDILTTCPNVAKHKARNGAYRLLAEQLEIPVKECHIGMMDEATCDQTERVMRIERERMGRALVELLLQEHFQG